MTTSHTGSVEEQVANLPPILQDFDTILRAKGIVPTLDLLDMLGGVVDHYEQERIAELEREEKQ